MVFSRRTKPGRAMSLMLLELLVVVTLVFSIAGCGSKDIPVELVKFTMVTGGTTGTYYPIGGAIAKITTDFVAGAEATTITSEGSVANARSIGSKEAELALIENTIAYYAEQGSQMFAEDPVKDIRGIAALYPEIVQIVTLEEYGITSLSDLKEKIIGVGAPGSGTAVHIIEIFKATGLDEANVDIRYLDFAECAEALKSGAIHVGCVVAGIPTSAVRDIAAVKEVAIVPVPDEIYSQMSSKYPFYVPVLIPAGTYSGVDEDVVTIAVQAMLATRSDIPEDLVYDVTKAIFEHPDVLIAAHERGKDITLETALDGMSIPLHHGAQRYFEEIGLSVP
ncbi:TAXI family TRAP transporter solute-binding subunit [Chloroflexota bacterium]